MKTEGKRCRLDYTDMAISTFLTLYILIKSKANSMMYNF